MRRVRRISCILALLAPALAAQGTQADYERASKLADRFEGLAVNLTGPVFWIGKTPRFWYRKSIAGGYRFVVVDAEKLTKKPAFDHDSIARSLSAAAGKDRKSVV